MKVFDFDNTLYRGESSIDLSFYMVRYNRRILLYVPTILISLVRYKMCLMGKNNDRALMKLARRVYIVKKGIPHRVSRKHRKKLRLQ